MGANRTVLVTGVDRLCRPPAGRPARRARHAGARARPPLAGGPARRASRPSRATSPTPRSLARACEGVDVVVNLASITADRKPPPGGYDRVNAEGAGRARDRGRATAGVRRFVHLAGIDTTIGPPGPYLAGRRRGDAAVLAAGIESVAILRPSIMFGGEDAAFIKALARLVKLAPAVPVPGRRHACKLQMVWVEDVVRCIVQLADDMRPGQFPIGGPDQPTYDEVLDLIGEGLGKKRVRKLHLPVPFFARAGARCSSLLPSPPLTPAALELFASDNVTTTDAIEQQFGFRPRGFAEHVRREGLYA